MNVQNHRGFASDDEAPIYREAPANIDAEQALLGAILVNNDAFFKVADFLVAGHFFEPIHKRIFDCAAEMIRRGRTVNPVTIKDFLPGQDRVGDISLTQYLARLASEATTIINARDYGEAIKDTAVRRELISLGEDLVNEAFDAPLESDPKAQIEIAEERLAKLRGLSGSGAQESDDIASAMDTLMSRMSEAKAANRAGVPVPLDEIAEILQEPCLQPGNLYGLLGASGEGKTSLTLQFAWAACEAGHPTLILSFDQNRDQVLRQMWSQASGITVSQMLQHDPGKRETMRQGDWRLLCDARDRMRNFELSIRRLSNMGVNGVTALAKRWVVEKRKKFEARGLVMPAPLIILDHVSAVTPEDRRADSGTIASSINRPCKAMAEELGAAWLSLNQRNGQGNGRDVPRPIASDLYGGEASRMDYDAILYLYRPERWRDMALRVAKDGKQEGEIRERFKLRKSWRDPGEEPEGMAEIGAIKVRYGDTNVAEFVRFEGRFTRYASTRSRAPELF